RSLRIRPQELDPSKPFDLEAIVEVERPLPRGRLRLVLRPTAELLANHTAAVSSANIDVLQLVDVPAPSEVLREVGTWKIQGRVEQFPMFPGTYSFSLELLEDPHNDILDVATYNVRVPGSL